MLKLPYHNTRGSSTTRTAILNYDCPFISLGCLGSGRAILANKANEQYSKTSKPPRSGVPQRWGEEKKRDISVRILVYNPPAFLSYCSYSILVCAFQPQDDEYWNNDQKNSAFFLATISEHHPPLLTWHPFCWNVFVLVSVPLHNKCISIKVYNWIYLLLFVQ